VDPNLQEFLNIVLQYLVPAVATALGIFAAMLVREFTQFVKDKRIVQQLGISERNLYFARQAIEFLIQAAEQSGVKDDIVRTGAEKKAWVLDRASTLLAERGITDIDIETLSDLVEASIMQGFNQKFTPVVFPPITQE
jgi:hypothetical protein